MYAASQDPHQGWNNYSALLLSSSWFSESWNMIRNPPEFPDYQWWLFGHFHMTSTRGLWLNSRLKIHQVLYSCFLLSSHFKLSKASLGADRHACHSVCTTVPAFAGVWLGTCPEARLQARWSPSLLSQTWEAPNYSNYRQTIFLSKPFSKRTLCCSNNWAKR